MTFYNLVAMLALSFLGCSHEQRPKFASQSALARENKDVTLTKDRKTQETYPEIGYNISNSEGVIVANVGDNISKSLYLYNEDGTLWLTASFEGLNKGKLAKIFPFALSIDTYLLVFKCVGVSRGYYKIIVNEQTGERKYIKTADTSFKFKKWGDHILDCFSVGFNPLTNPIKANPTDKSKSLSFDKDEFYMPVKTDKEWLQVRWGEEGQWKYGWVKWRKGSVLLLELFYTA